MKDCLNMFFLFPKQNGHFSLSYLQVKNVDSLKSEKNVGSFEIFLNRPEEVRKRHQLLTYAKVFHNRFTSFTFHRV